MDQGYHMEKSDVTRFWSKVDRSGECWIWTSQSVTPEGYGQFFFREYGKRRQVVAHRIAFVLANGPIPDGMLVMHTCDNTGCVRPDHLLLGTHLDNHQDKAKKRRSRNQYSPGAKRKPPTTGPTTPQHIQDQIVMDYMEGKGSQSEIAQRYGTHQATVSGIVRRRFSKLPAFHASTPASVRKRLLGELLKGGKA